jgi:hypothetical protein
VICQCAQDVAVKQVAFKVNEQELVDFKAEAALMMNLRVRECAVLRM